MTKQTYGPIEIFRTGTFKPMVGEVVSYTDTDLQQMVDSYDAEGSPAPVVLGHPSTDAPAFAWVDKLYVEGNKLKATIARASVEFVGMVRDGKYAKVSPSFFKPDAPNNPTPGKWNLKHLGFLGAASPAVSGLAPVAFADLEQSGCVAFAMEPETASFSSADQLELETLRKEKSEMAIEKLIDQGRVLPTFKDEIIEFASQLDSTQTFEFSEGEAITPRNWFLSYLAKQPRVVSFGATDLGDEPTTVPTPSITVPSGYTVDADQSELHARAQQIQIEKNVSFSEAVDLAMVK